MSHSLSTAVASGIINEEAAFCGLHHSDIAVLNARGFGELHVLVRFRSATGDGRVVATIADVAANAPMRDANGHLWPPDEILDVRAFRPTTP